RAAHRFARPGAFRPGAGGGAVALRKGGVIRRWAAAIVLLRLGLARAEAVEVLRVHARQLLASGWRARRRRRVRAADPGAAHPGPSPHTRRSPSLPRARAG